MTVLGERILGILDSRSIKDMHARCGQRLWIGNVVRCNEREPLSTFSRFRHGGLMALCANTSINRTEPLVLAKADRMTFG